MTRRLRLTGLLRHPVEPRVLLLRSDRTWRLPSVRMPGETWVTDARTVVPAFERRLGTRPWLLRHLSYEDDETRGVLEAVQELELADRTWRPPANGRWAASEDLERLRLEEAQRPVAASYLERLEAVPPQRPAWSLPGWREQLTAWVVPELDRLGRRLVALEQVKVWGISTVLRVETDRGDLYFKASAPLPLFVNEAVVTERLAARVPGYVPAPVAVERERGWILFEPFDVVGWQVPLDVRCELYRRVAALQVETIGCAEELIADGCLDRRLETLAGRLDALVADRGALHRLTAAEVRSLRRLAPRLQELLRRLDALGLPPTLVHGDLHAGNALRLGGAIAFFDWTDACVAHPFVDLQALQWAPDEETRAALLDAYLEPWGRVAAEETLREAVAIARVVTPLHHAVSYATIAASVEPSSKLDLDATHEFLREALARLAEL